jgi:hypothetical protein
MTEPQFDWIVTEVVNLIRARATNPLPQLMPLDLRHR